MPYQSFSDQAGDSDSAEKMRRLKMPDDLTGKSFLDIGCSEGFFCIEAAKRGAHPVIGIDSNENAIALAKQRAPHLDFRRQTWDVLPEGKFDIILVASALHYEQQPKDFLDKVLFSLAKNGLLLLEAGTFLRPEKLWIEVPRGDASVVYPTINLLMENLLENFSVRWMGASVDQKGDPVPRQIFHCQKYKPTVMVIPGASGSGKTTLAVEMSRIGAMRYSTDFILGEIARANYPIRSKIRELIKDKYDIRTIHLLVPEIVKAGLSKEFAALMVQYMPKEARIIVAEGFSLSPPEIYGHFISLLGGAGFKVWRLNAEN